MAKTKPRRKRARPGDIVQVELGEGKFAFAQVLEPPLVAFFELCADRIPPLEEIAAQPVAFRIWVMKYATSSDGWPVIGHAEIPPERAEPPTFFKKDPLNGALSLYRQGQETRATREQVRDLECAAVWEPEHVVERLRDHFAGRPNRWVEVMRP